MRTGALYRGEQCVVDRVLLADHWRARLRGLLGRGPLLPGQGLLLTPCDSVHTCWMRYPLDLVFLDRRGVVLGWREQLRPWRACRHPGARATLELPAGAVSAMAPGVGDVLRWHPDPAVAPSAPFAAHGSPRTPHDPGVPA